MLLIPSLSAGPATVESLHRLAKGWGYELWLVNRHYCGKLLHFQQGRKCSWHYHRQKEEVFFLHRGRLRVRYSYGDDLATASEVLLLPGMAFAVPVGLRHQMEAEVDSDLFGFSSHHDDDDSIRLVCAD
jgi:mannose-6-phosphate isomerase-like protein (cupin superfamily)